jgi:hypothetical protein
MAINKMKFKIYLINPKMTEFLVIYIKLVGVYYSFEIQKKIEVFMNMEHSYYLNLDFALKKT